MLYKPFDADYHEDEDVYDIDELCDKCAASVYECECG